MNSIIKPFTFADDGNNKREKENFQDFLFSKLDMSDRKSPISFYRSDFRGAKFQDVLFKGNNFSNSDFIDSSVINTTFENSKFNFSEIYNSYFEKSFFTNSTFSSTSLIKLVYKNCVIENTKFDVNTFRECKFYNCKISNSVFEKNSMDEVEFEKTSFKNIDLSNMTAINLFFSDCKFENVIIDADYLGSYFFKGKFFDNLKLKYRGKVFDLDISQSDLLDNLFKLLMQKGRYYEAINIVIQKNLLHNEKKSVFSLVKMASERLFKEKSQLKRTYQFDKIFRLLEYYINTGYVSLSDYFRIIGYFESLELSNLDFLDEISFIEKLNRLKALIERMDLTMNFIENSIDTRQILMEITIDESDKRKFDKYFESIMDDIGKQLSVKGIPYQVVGTRKGSLIYEIVAYTGAALILMKMLLAFVKVTRQTIHESIHLAIDYRIDTKALLLSKKLGGRDQIEKMKDLKEYQLLSKKALGKTSDVTSEDIEKLLPLIKSAVIYPNALPNRKD
ncbi:MAG: hypothetical protein K0R26_1977 [Bacteroidota bacterium]|jgi:uncharacterized protein YjbI with pentapeptide repeats|nr:hypothetical protein [Bacteroidota bacterium]